MTDSVAEGPVGQSVRIGFRVLQLGMILLALGWLTLNARQVPPDSQAVVLRFGRVVRVQPAGLVLAWPRPIETVVLLPAADRQLPMKIAIGPAGAAGAAGAPNDVAKALGETVPDSAGVFLTGDGGVVLLDASLTYRIADAAAYILAADHVAPALRRLFMASAVDAAAARDLDDLMAARPDRAGGQAAAQAQRETLRADLAAAINRRLRALETGGASLGVEIARVDLTALLPPEAKTAFDNVLNAAQTAEQGLATARTEAERVRQGADRDRDRALADAHAAAAENISDAHGQTAEIIALADRMTPQARPSLLDQVYRDRIARVLRQAGAVSAVDPRGISRMILP